MGRMNPSSYGPTEPHLWLVGKIPTRTWEKCRETSKSVIGWPGPPGQGCRPWQRLRLWRVAPVIARVAEIEM